MNPERLPLLPSQLTLSVVSHGQGHLVARLLDDLSPHIGRHVHVLVTINVPEREDYLNGRSFPIAVLRNRLPKGFGENHNQAFAHSDSEFFVVVNPDIRLRQLDFNDLVTPFADPLLGALSPVVRNSAGQLEDNARHFPSPGRILLRTARRLLGLENRSDYSVTDPGPTTVDWVAGMFVVFRSDVYRRVRGFDERYFMYLEDADICRRIRAAGYRVAVDSRAEVIHDAQRSTLRQWNHFRWHARSMIRFFGDTFWGASTRVNPVRTSVVDK